MNRRVGTAGWSIPRASVEQFPTDGSVLARYAQRFDSVEINSSFHKPHRPETYARWAASVPAAFRFSVKMPKVITHEKRLVDASPDLERFLSEVSRLGAKLGPLLLQFPPGFAFDPAVVSAFLRTMRSQTDASIVCEPRHPTWFTPEADGLLAERTVARVAADPARVPEAARCGGWQGMRYIRLHGSPRMYYSTYDSACLERIMRELTASPAQTWCIFDNTALGAATANALAIVAAVRAA